MVRPKLPVTRNRQLNIGLTDSEHEWVMRASAASGMRPVDFARLKVLAKRSASLSAATPADTHLDPLLLNALSRIGSNLNQLARQFNALRVQSPPELSPLLGELREILGKVRK